MKDIEKIILFAFLGFILFFYVISYRGTRRVGYVIHKSVDTVEITGKHVPEGRYGLSFYITYQEDKTMNRYKILVDKDTYNKTQINTSNKIKF